MRKKDKKILGQIIRSLRTRIYVQPVGTHRINGSIVVDGVRVELDTEEEYINNAKLTETEFTEYKEIDYLLKQL